MSPRSRPVDPERLLEHLDWVRGVARAVTHDAGDADDLTQEAYLAALAAPAPRGPMRNWLAGTVRNLARRLSRSERRRRDHEAGAAHDARGATAPDPAALIEAVHTQRELAGRVLALAEPYRSTLLERYWEDLQPSDIAARHSLPLATVKTRLRRGLAQLRAELEQDERVWAGVLWLAPAASALRPTNASAVLAAATLVACVTGALLSSRSGASHAARPAPNAILSAPTPTTLIAPPSPSATPRGVEQHPALGPQGPARVQHLSGSVFDLTGTPRSGVRVVFQAGLALDPESSTWSTRTAADGRFTMTCPDLDGSLRVADVHWTGVYHGRIHAQVEDGEATLVAAPARGFSGTVVDHLGAPVAGAKLTLRFTEDPRRALATRVLDQTFGARIVTHTDVHGHFAFEAAPDLAPGQVRITRVGHRVTHSELFPSPRVYVLPAIVEDERVLLGRVLHADGQPAPEAWVHVGTTSVRTDAAGGFQIALPAERGGLCVRAVAQGVLPARADLRAAAPDPAHLGTPYLDLVLGSRAARLTGRVVDAAGTPLAGHIVRSLDGEPFGRSWVDRAGGSLEHSAHVEDLMAGSAGGPATVLSDADGRFTLTGLQHDVYRLLVFDPRTLCARTTAPLLAGDEGEVGEVVLACEPTDKAGRQPSAGRSGRVVDRLGGPLSGVRIRPARELPLARAGTGIHLVGEALVSDGNGRFHLASLDPGVHGVILDGGPGFARRELALDVLSRDPASPAEVVLGRLCHLRIELPAHTAVDSAAFTTVQGDPLPAWVRGRFAPRLRLDTDHDGSFAVDERAAWLELYAAGKRLATHPAHPVPGAVRVLRP